MTNRVWSIEVETLDEITVPETKINKKQYDTLCAYYTREGEEVDTCRRQSYCNRAEVIERVFLVNGNTHVTLSEITFF